MTQNIYDNAEFFAGYSQLPRSVEGLDGAPEWPSLRALLPDISGLRVLDLGCGFGWFCRWARENGAARVDGIDVSENMLARARAETADTAVTYVRADMETLTLPPAAYDVVYSSLAFHYLVDLQRLVQQISQTLVPGGRLVVSVEHPFMTAPAQPGWSVVAGRKAWPINGYLEEGPRTTDWLTKGVVKQHRTLATYLNMLRACGFTLSHIEEWGPTPAQIAEHPEWSVERERPMFLLMSATR
jgi:SAM-dependent methyltransferase